MNRYNTKKCKDCGKATSVMAEGTDEYEVAHGHTRRVFVTDAGDRVHSYYMGYYTDVLIVPCRECGKSRFAREVRGKFKADVKCDGRCTSATGHNCECACGGANHGAAHAA